jgi:dTMP kinase
MLYAADRAQHVATVVRPALERGAVVVCDRYVDSSIAYQAGGRQLPESDVRRLSIVATGGLRPDLTVLLDVPPQIGLQRLTGPGDRMEAETVEFHERVRRTFLTLASQSRERYLVVNGSTSVDRIHEVVMARTLQLLLSGEMPHGSSPRPLATVQP